MFTLLFAAIAATSAQLFTGGALLGATLYTAAKTHRIVRYK